MMEKKVFSRIACLGLELTAAEWGEWCKTHDVGEVVFQYKEFGFNSHDVCLTPHITPVYEGKGCDRWEVHTAQSPNGRWTEGNRTGYGCSPVMFCSHTSNGYATEKEAIYASLLEIENAVKLADERYELSDQHISKKVLTQIAILKDRYDPRQLTLF